MPFTTIINQERAKEIIGGQLASGRIPHAYLFLGPDGVGRKKTAIALARALNCIESVERPGEPCGHCLSCQKIEQGIHPDVQVVDLAWQARLEGKEVEKQKSLKIDTIRAVQHEVSLKPTEGRWKVIIIEPAEKITVEAANCLLKTLEEPPQWTVIVLLAKHRENLPATVVSRTQIVRFGPLRERNIAAYLVERCGAPAGRAAEIASLAEGSLSAALTLLKEKETVEDSLWEKLKDTILPDAELLSISQENAKNVAELLDELLAEAKKDFRSYPRQYRSALQAILGTRDLLERNVNPSLALDVLLLDLNRELHR